MRARFFAAWLLAGTLLLPLAAEAKCNVYLLSGVQRGEGELFFAEENPLIAYKNYLIQADRVIMDRNASTLEVIGHVRLWEAGTMSMLGEHLWIDLNSSYMRWSPYFFYDEVGGMWSRADVAESRDNRYYLRGGVITSSCQATKPDWSIRYSSGYYDKNDSYVMLYNARLSVGEWPLLYLPFFAYPTSSERRSGLLPPQLGYDPDEGFIWVQPYYIALSPQWDLELDPQWRSLRGRGLNSTFRFVDSPFSKGEMHLGYFRDSDSYNTKANQERVIPLFTEHTGLEFRYQRRRLFGVSDGGSEGLWIDYKNPSDVDYFNLWGISQPLAVSSQVISQANYFMQSGENYIGTYIRYFEDLAKTSNDDTIQYLPQLQYHRNLGLVFDSWRGLLYSADYKLKNYTRTLGATAKQQEFLLPIQVDFPLFDQYLHLSFSENFYLNSIRFADDPTDPEDYQMASSYHKIRAYSDLIRFYDTYSHALSLSAAYIKPELEHEKGGWTSDATLGNLLQSLYEKERVSITAKNYFFDFNDRLFFVYTLSQPWSREEEEGLMVAGKLSQEFQWMPTSSWTFKTEMLYDHDRSLLSDLHSSLGYEGSRFSVSLVHIYKDEMGTIDTSYYTAALKYRFNSRYTGGLNYEYDAVADQMRSKQLSLAIRKSCWNYDISLKRENRAGSLVQNTVLYMKLELVPLGQFEQKFSIE